MHIGGREIAQPAVMMRVVVPREETAAHAAAVFDGAEPIRKLRPVFERAELGFRKRIVVAHAGPRVTSLEGAVAVSRRGYFGSRSRRVTFRLSLRCENQKIGAKGRKRTKESENAKSLASRELR